MRNQTAVLVLVDIAPDSFLWGLSRYVIGRFSLRNIPGLQFFKVLGSGFEGGFSTKPSFHKQGLFCVFDSEQHAKQFRAHSTLVQSYLKHSREFFAVTLNAFSTRGSWANTQLDVTAHAPVSGPIASLTRASIKPLKANAFWKNAQPAEVSINQSEGVILSAGLGEAPYLRQATFTIWEDETALNAYAQQGAHLAAIKAAYGQQYFSESMFTRFTPSEMEGTWRGKHYG
ncbi:spheroidene monooxygenase [Polynucleobacter sp.]|jgi:spheroidene monooxygenase|uniref:spheroidene monooxygenase n=1 Tax=Polynucleobacter sp. TaxID=2029855 RepID=UPI002736BB64|nr:spheroidene monooxygenase [Polynucleobacter sp.]MDP3122609.1 spheroidene monooxygenase [Polynucleobacter sp.]